jgi:hypothetical protein
MDTTHTAIHQLAAFQVPLVSVPLFFKVSRTYQSTDAPPNALHRRQLEEQQAQRQAEGDEAAAQLRLAKEVQSFQHMQIEQHARDRCTYLLHATTAYVSVLTLSLNPISTRQAWLHASSHTLRVAAKSGITHQGQASAA